MTDIEFEAARRMKEIRGLGETMGASFTLGRIAMAALRRQGAAHIDWEDVHKRTIVESISVHGQDPDDVLDAITRHSPAAVRPEAQDRLRNIVGRVAPDLAARYDAARAKENASYEAEKAANGGRIKFIK